jgi:hypothetical protein
VQPHLYIDAPEDQPPIIPCTSISPIPRLLLSTLAVQETQVAVPSQRDNVHHQHPMMQWHQFEIDRLHKRPHHPILLQCRSICTLQFIFRARPLHNRHTTQENEKIRARENDLICPNPCENFEVLVLENDFVLEEFEPGRGCWPEDSC